MAVQQTPKEQPQRVGIACPARRDGVGLPLDGRTGDTGDAMSRAMPIVRVRHQGS